VLDDVREEIRGQQVVPGPDEADVVWLQEMAQIVAEVPLDARCEAVADEASQAARRFRRGQRLNEVEGASIALAKVDESDGTEPARKRQRLPPLAVQLRCKLRATSSEVAQERVILRDGKAPTRALFAQEVGEELADESRATRGARHDKPE